MRVLSLFAGVGMFDYGFKRAGWTTPAFVEIDPFCQKVLRKHHPGAIIYDDVCEVIYERLKKDGIVSDTSIDVIAGGFPCQDLSTAGNQAGIGEGTRSGLWSEFARIIGEVRPRYAIIENVPALLTGDGGRWFDRILIDLAEIGFDAEWHIIPAGNPDGLSCGARHRRERVWIVAYPNINTNRHQEPGQSQTTPDSETWRALFGDPGGTPINVANPSHQGLQGREWMGQNPGETGGGRQSASLPVTQQGAANGGKSNTGQSKPNMGEPVNGASSGLLGPRIAHYIMNIPACRTCGEKHGIPHFTDHESPCRICWEDGTWEQGVPRVVTGGKDRVNRLKALGNGLMWQIPWAIAMAINERLQ